jgi:methionyl-tRNA formyltransferase
MSNKNTIPKLVSGYNFAFFGTSEFSVIILDELKAKGFVPKLVVTVEDKPKGRKLILTPSEVKVWAEKEGIPYVQPKTLRKPEGIEMVRKGFSETPDFFVVASYGKILPKEIVDMPTKGIINVHPSLLPKLRGPAPIEGAILGENETGVTIMCIDEEVDHGNIIAQRKIDIPEWPPYAENLERKLAHEGGALLAEILPNWIEGQVTETEQNHSQATFSKKIEKSDAELDLNAPAEINLRKIRAYHAWPSAFFFLNGKRIIVKRAHIEENKLVIDRVVPEGKKEMDYKDFLRGKN